MPVVSMLDKFLIANRDAIIARAQGRVAARMDPKSSDVQLLNGIPVFLDQLGDALRLAKSSDVVDHAQIGKTAGRHGCELLRLGLTIAQVVHTYGDVCQSVTELAVHQDVLMSADEFQTLNLCLDDAIAEAVTEYSRRRESAIKDRGTERLGVLAHELRNLLHTAILSFQMIESGRVAVAGSTGLLLGRSLARLRDLVDRSLADVRLDAGIENRNTISVAELVEELEIGTSMYAEKQHVRFVAPSVDRRVTIEGDRQIIAAAISNLLHNAFKFTRKQGSISLRVRATAERVLFEVEDECGGLPPGSIDELFRPFEQRGTDHSGVGLGLSISLKAAKANAGEIHVRDLPGKGCIFTLDLPRLPTPTVSALS
jgi:signal transduction histidine kinase